MPTGLVEAAEAGGGSWAGWIEAGLIAGFEWGIKEIMNVVMSIFAFALWITGAFLDGVINITIVQMNTYINKVAAIDIAWSKFRDIANMFFIFTILFIAIATILQIDRYQARTLLARVVLAAVLMNFSLVFTKALIDISNVVTVQFYNAVLTTPTQEPAKSLSAMLLTMTNVGTAYSVDSAAAFNAGAAPLAATAEVLKDVMKFGIATMGGVGVMLVLAFTFVVMGITLTARFVVLIFLMVLSPLMFLAWILPWSQKYASQWWDQLTKQLLFPPLFFALLFVALSVLNGLIAQFNPPQNFTAAFVQGTSAGVTGVLLNYVLIISFILGALLISVKVGAIGSGMANSMVQKARQKTISYAKNTGGFVGRNTLGFGADKLGGALKGFTARNPTMGGMLLNATGAVSGASFGGRKGGYTKAAEDRAKNIKKQREFLAKGPGGDVREKQYMDNLNRGALNLGIKSKGRQDAINTYQKDRAKTENQELQKEDNLRKMKLSFSGKYKGRREEQSELRSEEARLQSEAQKVDEEIKNLEKEKLGAPSGDKKRYEDDISRIEAQKSALIKERRDALKQIAKIREDIRADVNKIREARKKS